MSWKDEFPKEKRYFETENGILYKGDCIEIMKKFPNNSIDLIVTDPPYNFKNIGCGGSLKEKYKYRAEKLGELSTYNPENFLKIIRYLLKIVNAYIWSDKNLLPDYLNYAINNKYNYDILIYGKKNPIPAYNNAYLKDVEFCVFIREKGAIFNNSLGYDTYRKLMIDNVNNKFNNKHPTIKHLWMIKKMIKVSSKEGDIVLDSYLGSGTTAVACELLNRRWIGLEIEEEYCEFAVERIKKVLNQKKLNNWFKNGD